tara:strand:- start:5029 stop:5559 length:531 start_codon:yes stop_codon:yes gene_type:complete
MAIKIISSSSVNLSREDKHHIFEIMRIAYATTEIEIWGEDYVRISEAEYFSLIDDGKITVAYFEGVIAGCNQVYEREDGSFGFGLLATHQEFRKRGIGRALIENAENRARTSGAKYMEIEILRPRDIEVPGKLILQKWYESMGYEYVYSENFANRKPIKAKRLIRPSDFDCYRKTL